MKKNIKNFCQFEIRALNQEKLFNTLSQKCKIYDLDRKSKDHTFFKVKYFDSKKIENELKKENIDILSIKKRGFVDFLIKKLLSIGLVLGFSIGIIMFFLQAEFIRKIEVWGNDKITDQEIVQVVKSEIKSGFKKNINTKEIESKIYNTFENLSFVSVGIFGQTVIVNIKEELIPEEMQNNFEVLKADFDGIVTKIDLIQGTLCVKIGDIVKKGDALVMPYVKSSNVENMPIKPMAKIEFEAWISGESIHNSSYQETFKTGNILTENEVYVGNLKIYEKKANNNYKNFVVEESFKNISKNNILPFYLKTTSYYETKTRLLEQNFEDVKDEIILKAKENALQKIEDCDIIKEEKVTIKHVANLTYVYYTITISKTIGG